MNEVHVKAAPGVRVPMDGEPLRYIKGEPHVIELTPYYQRRINDGDLMVIDVSRSAKEIAKANDQEESA